MYSSAHNFAVVFIDGAHWALENGDKSILGAKLEAHLIESFMDTEELDESQLEGIQLLVRKVWELAKKNC